MEKSHPDNSAESLFDKPLDIISIGLEGFAEELVSQQVQVTQLDWRPPAEGDAELADLLSKLGS